MITSTFIEAVTADYNFSDFNDIAAVPKLTYNNLIIDSTANNNDILYIGIVPVNLSN